MKRNSFLCRFFAVFFAVCLFFGDVHDAKASPLALITTGVATGTSVASAIGTALIPSASTFGGIATGTGVSAAAVMPISATAAGTAALAGASLLGAALAGVAVGVAAVLAYQAIRDLVNGSDGDNYPALKAAAGNTPGTPKDQNNATVGDVLSVNGSNYQLTGIYKTESGFHNPPGWVQITSVWAGDGRPKLVTFDGYTRTQYYYAPTSSPVSSSPATPKSDNDVQKNLTNNGGSGSPVTPNADTDIKKAISSGKLAPTIVNPSTGQPVTQAEIQQAVDAAVASATKAANSAAASSAQAAVSTANAATNAAQAAVTAAQNALASDPANSALQDKLAAATAALSTAQTTEAALKTELDKIIAKQMKEETESIPSPVPEAPARKRLDWSKFDTLKGALSNTFPFSLVSTLPAFFSAFSDAAAPVFQLPMPMGKTLTVDLAIFDPVALVIRWLFGLSATVGAVYVQIKFWRGVS